MKKLLTLIAGTLILSMTACVEKTSEKTEVTNDKPAVIVVPDKKVDVNVHTDTAPAPVIINHEKSTNTTIHTDGTGSSTTHTETVH